MKEFPEKSHTNETKKVKEAREILEKTINFFKSLILKGLIPEYYLKELESRFLPKSILVSSDKFKTILNTIENGLLLDEFYLTYDDSCSYNGKGITGYSASWGESKEATLDLSPPIFKSGTLFNHTTEIYEYIYHDYQVPYLTTNMSKEEFSEISLSKFKMIEKKVASSGKYLSSGYMGEKASESPRENDLIFMRFGAKN